MKYREAAIYLPQAAKTADLLVYQHFRRVDAVVRFKTADDDDIGRDRIVISKRSGELRVFTRGSIKGNEVGILLKPGDHSSFSPTYLLNAPSTRP
jgi:hypothetical protein